MSPEHAQPGQRDQHQRHQHGGRAERPWRTPTSGCRSRPMRSTTTSIAVLSSSTIMSTKHRCRPAARARRRVAEPEPQRDSTSASPHLLAERGLALVAGAEPRSELSVASQSRSSPAGRTPSRISWSFQARSSCCAARTSSSRRTGKVYGAPLTFAGVGLGFAADRAHRLDEARRAPPSPRSRSARSAGTPAPAAGSTSVGAWKP